MSGKSPRITERQSVILGWILLSSFSKSYLPFTSLAVGGLSFRFGPPSNPPTPSENSFNRIAKNQLRCRLPRYESTCQNHVLESHAENLTSGCSVDGNSVSKSRMQCRWHNLVVFATVQCFSVGRETGFHLLLLDFIFGSEIIGIFH